MRPKTICSVAVCLALSLAGAVPALAGAHTWDVNEVFSNADGTIQFIELREMGGGTGETFVAGHMVTSNSNNFTITSNVASPTSFRTILFATAAFAALPGAPTPNYIIPANFLSTAGDTISYTPYDSITYGPGVLPTDGVLSINHSLASGVNSPTNYAGQTGSINVGPPAGVPDGSSGSTPMTVAKLDAAGASLSISWDTTTCGSGANHKIVYGDRSRFPATPGGAFGAMSGQCGMGVASPMTWNLVPDAGDGSGLLWWVLVGTDGGSVEGSWGEDDNGLERVGPGPGGASMVCGATSKSLTNACGH